jgi:succinate-acetate transporter protein
MADEREKFYVMPATLANPAPLGLCGFGLTTFVLNVHNAGFHYAAHPVRPAGYRSVAGVGAGQGITRIAGWEGIFCAFTAWYLAAAVIINDSFGRTVLPVGPIPKKA